MYRFIQFCERYPMWVLAVVFFIIGAHDSLLEQVR